MMRLSSKTYRYACQKGSIMLLFAAMAVMLIAFMGVTIYSGLQTFIQQDLQRVSMNAAMVGAASYYQDKGANGKPVANGTAARNKALATFRNIVNASSLGGFSPTATVTNNDASDSVTVSAVATFGTSLLAPVGINTIEAKAESTARALKYEPTKFTGSISILPDETDIASYSQVIDLTFPMVDGPGNDLYIEQDAATQQGYIVEACNNTNCYNLVSAATLIGSSQRLIVDGGEQAIYGSAIFDLSMAGVRKASKIRITHANNFDLYNAGVLQPAPTVPTPLELRKIMIFGYAGACASSIHCAVPGGFAPVE